MKKVLLMMAFVMPVMMMAQTKTAPQKPRQNPPQERVAKTSFEYMEMIATEVVEKAVASPKKSNKSKEKASAEKTTESYQITFNFGRESKDLKKRVGKASTMNRPMDALSYLGTMGWELTAVSGNSYYLKRRAR